MKGKLLDLARISLPLVVICTLMVALIAAVNHFTAPVINENEKALFNQSVKDLFGLSKNEEPTVDPLHLPENKPLPSGALAAYTVKMGEKQLGYCMEVTGSGAYGEDLRMLVAIDGDGQIIDLCCLASSETPGKGDKVLNDVFYSTYYLGRTVDEITSADPPILSGSTKTSTALYNAVDCALALYQALTVQKGDGA
ncbi:MAG: FMN-binding protein [Clostridia bacterium]|nr:FMN-binding protein [Clostridia bacterium]